MATKRQELVGALSPEVEQVLRALQQPAVQRLVPVLSARAAKVLEQQPAGCFAKADLDEPVFVLRAQDRCASFTVRQWAERARGAGCTPAKVAEAMALAVQMEQWAELHPTKWPD